MISRAWLAPLPLLVACGAGAPTSPAAPSEPFAPGFSVPVAIAEGRPQPGTEPLPPPGGTESTSPPISPAPTAAAAPRVPDLPDPEPLRLARQWEYVIAYDRGEITVASVRPLLFQRPVVTPRRIGRYAIELWIGRELIDRLRFDFPALAAEEPMTTGGGGRPLQEPSSLAPGARVRRVLLVPASPRATRAVLVDRATGATQELPWPPDRPLAPIEPASTAEVPPSAVPTAGEGSRPVEAAPAAEPSPPEPSPPEPGR